MTAPDRRWISPLECAQRLNLHVQSIYKKFWAGEIPVGRIGRTVRIDWLALERQIEAGMPKGGSSRKDYAR